MEQKVLNLALNSRAAFTQLQKYIHPDDLDAHSRILYTEIEQYYKIDTDAQACDKEIILERIARAHPKHEEAFRTILLHNFARLAHYQNEEKKIPRKVFPQRPQSNFFCLLSSVFRHNIISLNITTKSQ